MVLRGVGKGGIRRSIWCGGRAAAVFIEQRACQVKGIGCMTNVLRFKMRLQCFLNGRVAAAVALVSHDFSVCRIIGVTIAHVAW